MYYISEIVLDDRNIVIYKVDSPCLHGKQIQEVVQEIVEALRNENTGN